MEPADREERVVYCRCCRGKVAYRTRSDAKDGVRETRAANKIEGSGDVEAYRCVFCGLWHVGHTLSTSGMMWPTHVTLWRRRHALTGEVIPALFCEVV